VLIFFRTAHGAKFAKAPRRSDISRLSIRAPAHFPQPGTDRAGRTHRKSLPDTTCRGGHM